MMDVVLMPTPSTSSASPSVELRHGYEVLSDNNSPEETRTDPLKDGEILCTRPNNIADSLKIGGGRKQRAVVYESQISPELEGIKLKIKKSPTQDLSASVAVSGQPVQPPKTTKIPTKIAAKPKKPAVGRGRKKKKKKKGQSDDEGTEEEENDEDFLPDAERYSKTVPEDNKNKAQSIWASDRMPPEILTKIFMEITHTEGCVPTLVILSRVCRLWWQVSYGPLLWHTVDLATGRVKEKHRTERKLFWLLQNRLTKVQDLALGGWNSALSRAAIEGISTTCKDLRSLSLTGCKGLMGDSLLTVVQSCGVLQKLDLSAVSVILI